VVFVPFCGHFSLPDLDVGTGINVDWFYRLPIVSVIAFLPGIQSLKEDEMRKISVLIGICMLAALAITILAQQAPPTDLSPVMKDVAATTNKLRMDLMSSNAADVAADAEKLQGLFRQAAGFFKAQKAQDAVDFAKANVQRAGDIMKAAKENNLDAAKAPAGDLQKSCKNCHDVHREQLPDKTFKFKP